MLRKKRIKDKDRDPTIEEMRKITDHGSKLGFSSYPYDAEKVEANGIPCLFIHNKDKRKRTILWLHGGGYVAGHVWSMEGLLGEMAGRCEASILAVEYRLAPEYPLPAGLEDSLKAYDWLVQERSIPAQQIAIAGESAGGGMAIHLAALLCQRFQQGSQVRPPAAVAALSPFINLKLDYPSLHTHDLTDVFLGTRTIIWTARQALGGYDPLKLPAMGNLSGYPPYIIFIGSEECLIDDSMNFYKRAQAAGAQGKVVVGDGLFHVWPLMYDYLPEANQSLHELAQFLVAQVPG